MTSETNTGFDFRFGYTGRERDKETGLQYNRARYYDPSTGGFIGQDPIGFGGGDANLYRYVGNGPTNLTDAYGKSAYDILRGVDQVVAGFGDAVSFGATTQIRDALYGDTARQNESGALFTGGQVLGTGVSLALGYGAEAQATKLAPLLVRGIRTYDAIGAGIGFAGSSAHLIRGCFTPIDLLGFAPLIGAGLQRGIKFVDGRRTIPLYRAVKDLELSSIQQTRTFQNPKGIESKYFSLTEDGASSYAKQAYYGFKDPAYTNVQTGLQKRFITQEMSVEVDRGINAIVIPTESLPNMNTPKILPTMSIPKN